MSNNGFLERLLIEIGILPNKIGYDYLRELILLSADEASKRTLKPMYEKIAVKYGVSSKAINRGVMNAIEYAHQSGKLKKLNNILKIEVCDDGKSLKNGEFIFLLSKYVKGSLN